MRRRSQCYELRSIDGASDVASGLERGRERVATEKSDVIVLPVDGLDNVRLEGSQPHVMPVAGEKVRERSLPGARSNDGAAHQSALSFFTNLCSSPRRRRPIFSR